ncbi:MAG TPA: hypothetical protein VF042_12415 [Gemmatimonadaceae bacterium]
MKTLRRRLIRVVAALLAIGLPAQVAQAQSVACAEMGAPATAHGDRHAAIAAVDGDHHAAKTDSASTAKKDGQGKSATTPACAQGTVCMTSAAVPVIASPVQQPLNFVSAIPVAALPLQARTLRPDSPPPKLCASTDSARR